MKALASPQAHRIFVIDDHPIIVSGWAKLLAGEQDLSLCGHASDGVEALVALSQAAPDLAVIDVRLPGVDGIELCRRVTRTLPQCRVLLMSMFDDTTLAQRGLAAGAHGYVSKTERPEKMLEAVRLILGGRLAFSAETSGPAEVGESKAAAENVLTTRELEILRLLGKGLGSREIGDELHISVKTVETHRSNIKSKLKLKSAQQLLQYAARWYSVEKS